MLNIDELIKTAIKSKDLVALNTYRSVKTAFMEYTTAKNAKPLDDVAEISIIRKLISQRKDAADQYILGNRQDLSEKELAEADILSKLLPEEPNSEDIKKYAEEIIKDKQMSLMGRYIKAIKDKYPIADGKIVSDIVKSIINS